MTISALVIADSINCQGIRLTTFQLRYPRFIHAEELTHRILETQPEMVLYEAIPDGLMYDPNFSRNASSSRAIPIKRMIEDLRRDPAMPIYWGGHQPGMQAGDECFNHVIVPLSLGGTASMPMGSEAAWLAGMEMMIGLAQAYADAGYHKQIVNRLLEPWAHINVVVTATDYENFFALRRHADAQPEIKALADAMWDAREASTPELLQPGQWHLPYVDQNGQSDDRDNAEDLITANGVLRVVPQEHQIIEILKKVSVARCARVSYLTHDGRKTTVDEDLALYGKLVGSMPLHASPAEHQATPDQYEPRDLMLSKQAGKNAPSSNWKDDMAWQPEWEQPALHGNLRGWIQNRKTLPGEFVAG